MKRLMSLFVAAIVAIATGATAAPAGSPTVVRTITQSLGSWTATVDVRQVSADDAFAGEMWGGNASDPVGTAVARLALVSDSTTIWIPLSAFADLGNPRELSLERKGRGVLLRLRGGETGEAYDARFLVERSVLKSRRVNSAEMPEAWEETRYSGPVTGN